MRRVRLQGMREVVVCTFHSLVIARGLFLGRRSARGVEALAAGCGVSPSPICFQLQLHSNVLRATRTRRFDHYATKLVPRH